MLNVVLWRQVALTLTPRLPPIEHVTILPRGGVQSRVLFTPVVRCRCQKGCRLFAVFQAGCPCHACVTKPGVRSQGHGHCHPQESGVQGNQQNDMFSRARDMAGRPQSVFDYMCRLLVPLCAARAAEEVLYGRDSVTLSTASEVRGRCAWSRGICR